jgi:tape measure domain-containing protein
MINLTVIIDNDEAIRRFKELQSVAKTTTSSVVTDSDRMDAAIHRVASTLAQIGVAASLTGLVRKIALVRGEFQQLEVAFTTLLQSKEKADALMAQMIDLAAKTPFDLQGVANGARQLLAYGFAAEDITDTLTRLGNVAAGLGLPLERLTYLYGTTAVQGRLYARDMLQFTSSGIPVLQEMAKIYGKTTEEINSMVSAGKIGFEDVRKVIENMTNEGGQFYNLMQEQSKTITGLISNLGDALDTMFNDIGKSQEGIIAGVLQGTISLVENYQKVLDILIPLIAAYGAYKTAIIAVAAAQKIQTTIEATRAFFEQTKMLRRATQAQILFNKAVKANPYVLATSAIMGIVTALFTFSKEAKTTADIVSDLNTATNEYASGANKISRMADEYDFLSAKINRTAEENDKLKDVVSELASIIPSAVSKFDEYGNALDINIEKIREFNEERKKALQIGVTNQIEEAKKRLADIDKQIEKQQKIFIGKTFTSFVSSGGMYPTVHTVETPATEEQIADAVNKTNKLYAERDELVKSIANGEKTLQGITTEKSDNLPIKVSAASLKQTISDAREKLSQLQSEFADLQKGILPKDAGIDFDWKDAISNKQKAIKEQQDILNTLTGVDPKIKEKALDDQERLNEQILSNDQDLIQSRIDLMKDGQDKEIAEINARTQAKIESIEKAREKEEKAARAAGTSLTPERKKEFEEQKVNAEKERDNKIIATKKKYAEELDGIYKHITDVSLTEIDREIIGIEDKYKELSKKIMAAMEGGSISADDAGRALLKLDAAKTAETLDKILGQYKSTQQKITTIQKNAEAARKLARDNGQENAIERINKEEARAIGKIKAEDLMDSDDWINLFQNLDALSSREIRRIVENINEQLKNADLDPVNLKAVTDQLQRALDVAGNKNPFAGVIAGFKDYKEAQKKAIALQKKANETQDESDKIAADNAALDAIKKRQGAWQRVLNTVGDIGNSLQALNDLLGQFGVESPELEGVIGAFNSLSSIDVTKPFSIITGTVGAISSLIGGIFGGHDKRAEKRIQALQKSVEALEKAYEDLSEAVDKTYSRARQAVIASENKNLEAQKRLINQQIREEQSKKKTDQNRIKEWQEQLDNINKEIQNNKEAAYDAIFGEDLQSAISNFADAYADAWASGTRRAESAKDTVRKMMRQMATESIKDAISTSGAIQKIRDKLTEFYADNVLSEWEQNYIYKLADDLQRELDNKFGWADKLFTGESETGTLRGEISQSITEATASKLEGLMRGGYDLLKGIHGEAFKQTSLQQSNLNVNTGIFNAVIRIQANTARTANNTDGMTDLLTSLYSMLQKIAQNTATKYYGK